VHCQTCTSNVCIAAQFATEVVSKTRVNIHNMHSQTVCVWGGSDLGHACHWHEMLSFLIGYLQSMCSFTAMQKWM
jgi:hypothetical protein